MVGPDPQPPRPGILGVQPAQGLVTAGAGRLVEADVALDRKGEVRAERGVGSLVFEQLALGRQRQALEVVQPLISVSLSRQNGLERSTCAVPARRRSSW